LNQSELEALREGIDVVDQEILEQLAARFEMTRKIGKIKALENLPSQDREREEKQLKRISQLAQSLEIPEELALTIYRSIIDTVINEHRALNTK